MQVFNNSVKPNYFFSGPFRFVEAYEHCFRTHAKGRWIGNPILDVLEKEFKAYTRDYYQNAIEKGKILVNNKKQDINYRFKNNDSFEHYTLRVEPPILNVLPKVVFEDEKVLVVSKPPYLTVHATGGFHFNSLVGLLKFCMSKNEELHDKLTSGILILAKDRDFTKRFHESDEIKKQYLARVHGDFSHEYLEYEKPIYCISKKDGTYAVLDSTNEEEIKEKGAKPSKTIFKKLWYDEKTNSSLLECSPITGRTHQIRVHVSSLGFPIINDTQYGGQFLGNGYISIHFPHLINSNQQQNHHDNSKCSNSDHINDNQSSKNCEDNQNQDKQSEQQSEQQESEQIVGNKQNKSHDQQEQQLKQSQNEGDNDEEERIMKKGKNNEGEEIKREEKKILRNESEQSKEEENKNTKQKEIKGVGENNSYKLSEEDGIYKLEGNFIENHSWDYQTQPMEICLHSVQYTFQSYIFKDEQPYWADKNYHFKV